MFSTESANLRSHLCKFGCRKQITGYSERFTSNCIWLKSFSFPAHLKKQPLFVSAWLDLLTPVFVSLFFFVLYTEKNLIPLIWPLWWGDNESFCTGCFPLNQQQETKHHFTYLQPTSHLPPQRLFLSHTCKHKNNVPHQTSRSPGWNRSLSSSLYLFQSECGGSLPHFLLLEITRTVSPGWLWLHMCDRTYRLHPKLSACKSCFTFHFTFKDFFPAAFKISFVTWSKKSWIWS